MLMTSDHNLWPWELFQYFVPTTNEREIATGHAANAVKASPYLADRGVGPIFDAES